MAKKKKIIIDVETTKLLLNPVTLWYADCSVCDWKSDCVPFKDIHGICDECGEACSLLPCPPE